MATNSVSPKKGKVVDIPDATITIGTPTAGAGQVSVAFTVASTPATGGPVTKYTAISTPDSISGTASSSPVVVSGLTNGTAYTFKVAAGNSTGNGVFSSASASVTPVDPASFVSIATQTVGAGGVGTVTFSSIPSTYKHLQIRMMTKNAGANNQQGFAVTVNSDSGANYSAHYIQGDGASVYAGGGNASSINWLYAVGSSPAAQIFNPTIMDFLDYQNTNKYKTVRSMNAWDYNGGGYISYTSSAWLNTAAITSISLTHTGNFSQYSTFALYGIKG